MGDPSKDPTSIATAEYYRSLGCRVCQGEIKFYYLEFSHGYWGLQDLHHTCASGDPAERYDTESDERDHVGDLDLLTAEVTRRIDNGE